MGSLSHLQVRRDTSQPLRVLICPGNDEIAALARQAATALLARALRAAARMVMVDVDFLARDKAQVASAQIAPAILCRPEIREQHIAIPSMLRQVLVAVLGPVYACTRAKPFLIVLVVLAMTCPPRFTAFGVLVIDGVLLSVLLVAMLGVIALDRRSSLLAMRGYILALALAQLVPVRRHIRFVPAFLRTEPRVPPVGGKRRTAFLAGQVFVMRPVRGMPRALAARFTSGHYPIVSVAVGW